MYREFVSVLRREYLRWARVPIWVASYFVIPILYLILFGQAFNLNNLFPSGPAGEFYVRHALLGAPNYFSYFAVGMAAFVTLTASLYSGTGVLFDKQLGIHQRTIATPAPRSALFGGSLTFRASMAAWPAFLSLGVALLFLRVPGLVGLSVRSSVDIAGIGEILLAEALLALMFTALFLSFGYFLDSNEAYFGITSLLNLPILFTSNALFPQSTMPAWLQNVTSYNPASLAVNVMRENLFNTTGYPYPPEIYLLGLLAWAAALIGLALFLSARALRIS
ncbi:MAG TPA: ABC transporter permease [Thermoplasmata archaeon]|nr:ABC transporter permease [Thermoplasmata archaeon]